MEKGPKNVKNWTSYIKTHLISNFQWSATLGGFEVSQFYLLHLLLAVREAFV